MTSAALDSTAVPTDNGAPMRYGRLETLLRLAFLLAGTAEGLRLADIEREFEVSRRTAERMRDAVERAFPQVESVPDGRERRWRLPHGALRGLLDPSAEELAELEAAARRLREDGAAPERAALLEALAGKLKAAMRPEALRRADADLELLMEAEGTLVRPGPRPVLPGGVLPLLREAILASRELRVSYRRRGAAAPAARVIQPLGLLHGARPYLAARVRGAPGEPMLFRLDRMEDVEVLESAFAREEGFSLAAFAARAFGAFQEKPVGVCLRFTPEAAEDARRFHFHATQALEELPDGGLLVRFRAAGRLEMCHHLATWGEAMEDLEPDGLRRELSGWAGRSRNEDRRRLLAVVSIRIEQRTAPAACCGACIPDRGATVRILALDFETMSIHRDSAYQIGFTVLDNDRLGHPHQHLFRPANAERSRHYRKKAGPSIEAIRAAPGFAAIWERLAPQIGEADLVCAHRAAFDRAVLLACLSAAEIEPVRIRWVCTLTLAKQLWHIHPCALKDVLDHLGLRAQLRALHQAGKDSYHCARIVQAAMGEPRWRSALSRATLDDQAIIVPDPAKVPREIIVRQRRRRSYDQILFDALPDDGSAVGQLALRASLGWDDARFCRARDVLLEERRARIGPGRGGTLRRVVDDAARLLATLPEDGARMGRERLRLELGWDRQRFSEVVEALLARGLATPGPGRGGSLARNGTA